MNCIRCGRKIADNAVFCTDCSMPPMPVAAPTLPQTKRAAGKEAPKKEKKKRNYKKITRSLTVCVVLLSLLLVGISSFIWWQTDLYFQRKEALRIREAAAILSEKDAAAREARIQELEQQLTQTQQKLNEALQKLVILLNAPVNNN